MPTVTRRQAIGLLGALALPVEKLAAASGGVQFAPPASNLHDLANLNAIAERIARDKQSSLSFLSERWESLTEWKETARPVFLQHLSYSPSALPVHGEGIHREMRDGFSVETVRIRATDAYDIPARVLVPSGRNGRLPVVIALHCHGGRYSWGWQKVLSTPGESAELTAFRNQLFGRPYGEELVRRGYLVIVIDAFYFGERRLQAERLKPETVPPEVREHFRALGTSSPGSSENLTALHRVCRFYEHLTATALFAAGATWPGLHVWDDRRTIDYLLTRPDVDPERIACVGLSIGGLRAAHLIAADPRIRAACVIGWMTEFASLLPGYLRNFTWMAVIPGLYPLLDLPDAAGLHAPKALLVQQCRREILFSATGMQRAVEKLAEIYTKAGAPERFRGTFYDEPHSFKPHMQDEAFNWLERWV